MSKKKKYLVAAVIAFAAFYLLTKPALAAQAVNGVFAGVINAAGQLSVFLTHIKL